VDSGREPPPSNRLASIGTEDSPLTLDPGSGRIRLYGIPGLFTFPEFLLDLQTHLERTSGKAAKGLLYRVSFLAGRRTASMLGGPVGSADDAGALDSRLARFVDFVLLTGYGNLAFSVANAATAETEWTIQDSVIAELHSPSKESVCHIYAGFLAGALAGTFGRPVECIEGSCRAKGDEACVFRTRSAAIDPV
jgi:predicted hydrocarbon binding protein